MFITNAFAAAAPGSPTDTIMNIMPLIVIVGFIWFMIIRPQMKRSKDQTRMIAALQKGDEIITSGGQVGRVVKIDEQFVSLEIADGVVTLIQKSTILTMLPKGTIKSI